MLRSSTTKVWYEVLLFSTVTSLGIVLATPAIAQGYNFVDLNQSRQFFNEGHRNLHQEIEELNNSKQLPEIKLPQDYQQPQSLDNFNHYLDHQQKLRSLSSITSDAWQAWTSNERYLSI